MTEPEQKIMDRHVGRCMESLEQLRLEPATLRVIKGIVRNEMTQLGDDLSEAHDGPA